MKTPRKNIDPLLGKESLGLAAEYAVASELCRRGIYAQLTLGNRKRTDLLVDVEDGRMLRVQVKAKQKREWPACKGVCGSAIVLVLVDYEHKKLEDRPDFYILTQADWKDFLRIELTDSGQAEKWGTQWGDDLVPMSRDGFVGASVRASQVQGQKERWEKIRKLLGLPSHPISDR